MVILSISLLIFSHSFITSPSPQSHLNSKLIFFVFGHSFDVLRHYCITVAEAVTLRASEDGDAFIRFDTEP